MNEFIIEQVETDVAIIGGGLAGCMAAIKAAECGVSVTIIEKANTKRSGCAGSGIDHLWSYIPPVHEKMGWTIEDLVEDHATIVANGYIRKDLLRLMAETMYDRVLELEQFGIKFRFSDSKAPEGFRIVNQFHRVPSSFNFEGRDIKRVLTKEAKKRGVNILNRVMALELMVDDGTAYGVVGVGTTENKIYKIFAKSIVLSASGRINRLSRSFVGHNFNRRLPPSGTTGDGKAMVFRAGGELVNMEFFGSHIATFRNFPMSAGAPRSTLQPCARIVDEKGNVIIPRTQFYDWNNLNDDDSNQKEEMRRKLAAERKLRQRDIKDILKSAQGPLYLDCAEGTDEEIAYVKWSMSHEGKMWLFNEWLDDNGVDLKKDKIEFNMGDVEMAGTSASGIWVDSNCSSGIDGLFIAGDEIGCVPWAAGSGAISTGGYVGERAGKRALANKQRTTDDSLVAEKVKIRLHELINNKQGEPLYEIEYALQNIMDATFLDGLTSDALLKRGIYQLEDLQTSAEMSANNPHQIMRCLEVRNLMECAWIIMKSALERKESRGDLKKSDYPETDHENWDKFLTVRKGKDTGELIFSKKPINGLR